MTRIVRIISGVVFFSSTLIGCGYNDHDINRVGNIPSTKYPQGNGQIGPSTGVGSGAGVGVAPGGATYAQPGDSGAPNASSQAGH